MTRPTLRAINAAARAEGIEATLYKGNGYFYFQSDGCQHVPSIYSYALNQFASVEDFMTHVRDAWKDRS